MAPVITVNKKDLLGRCSRPTAVLEKIVQQNALNKTGKIDYNKYGKQDGVGFTPVTDMFVDNFVLRVVVPDYLTKRTKNKHIEYMHIGSTNKRIRELLDAHGLKGYKVKGIGLKTAKNVTELELSSILDRNITNETDDTLYYNQLYKVGCADIEFKDVLGFLRSANYEDRGLFLCDVDCTIDYAGSFNRDQVIESMVSKFDFRCQGTHQDGEKTILDNSIFVGNNCLTYIEDVNGITTRCKIYNKMVQMLECKAVRESIGCHWRDWVIQDDTRLATARDKASDRGLTRAEVTFYCPDGKVPSDQFLENTLLDITSYVDAQLVYSTPYHATWKAYCETFVHSLVVQDEIRDTAVLVYSYNELTRNISGQLIENWKEKADWCCAMLTLNGNLPLDIISAKEYKNEGDCMVEISGDRYLKIKDDKTTNSFTTRIVSRNGIYCYSKGSKESNALLLEKAGITEQPTCIPCLSHVKGNKNSKTYTELRKIDTLKVKIECPKQKGPAKNDNLSKEEARKFQDIVQPIQIELKATKEKLERAKNISAKFTGVELVKLIELKHHHKYPVLALKEFTGQYAPTYKLFLDNGDDIVHCFANSYIRTVIDATLTQELKDKLREGKRDFLTLHDKPLAELVVTGFGRDFKSHKVVLCNLTFHPFDDDACLSIVQEKAQKEIEQKSLEIKTVRANIGHTKPLELILEEHLPLYKDMLNLTALEIGSSHVLTGMGHKMHYGRNRLVLRLADGRFYQAGDYLESQIENLFAGTRILITGSRLNSSRQKYAICKIAQNGDWSGFLEYSKVKLLPTKRYVKSSVLDIKSMDVKGTKRKLVLLDNGEIFKLNKKSKLEEKVNFGDLL